jgi:ribose 5-phosphate isomerase
MLEFEAASAHIFEISPEQANHNSLTDRGAGLVNTLLIDKNAASEDQCLCTLAGGGVALVYEKFVEANLHERWVVSDE